jgi:hydrogenase maturation protein HypF
MEGLRLLVNGVVQGVGFRPFVYRLAVQYALTGWVQNTSGGVIIELNGESSSIQSFLDHFKTDLPPLARVESLVTESITPDGYPDFSIRKSEKSVDAISLLPADVAICPDCLKEMQDPTDRRYRYPFINCTNCGPRFSIIQDMPYDRPVTTMSGFPMCPDCEREYNDPANRRFHAQPIACPVCGPQVSLIQDRQIVAERDEAIQLSRAWLKDGKILAVKGLGGFLLACDAHNEDAINELRSRKRRSAKSFALMAPSMDVIRKYCQISPAEARLLESRSMPIVILKQNEAERLPGAIAPGQNTYGFMLPYTPLHVLLCAIDDNFTDCLVMTSGNVSEEPIIYRDSEMHRLDLLADAYLTHNRPIHIRMDDSVIRFMNDKPAFMRRSRGFSPEPVPLPAKQPSVLACGALLKNTVTYTSKDRAFVSQFIGDLENMETYRAFEQTVDHFKTLFKVQPEAVASDLHPDFVSTESARRYARQMVVPDIQVQHHHAHLAACLGENQWQGKQAIGLCYDGTGYGTDGAIWGGEVLIGNYTSFERICHLEYMPLPGGDLSIRKPYRIALAYLHQAGIPWNKNLFPTAFCKSQELDLLRTQLEKKLNTVPTSSLGRLFDAVASLAGIGQLATYEGQLAIELENRTDHQAIGTYHFDILEDTILVKPLLEQVVADSLQGVPAGIISAKFHHGLAEMNLEICTGLRERFAIKDVALSGGVWQNKTLLETSLNLLTTHGFSVYTHRQLPANDGCISYGQAVIAGHVLMERSS